MSTATNPSAPVATTAWLASLPDPDPEPGVVVGDVVPVDEPVDEPGDVGEGDPVADPVTVAAGDAVAIAPTPPEAKPLSGIWRKR